MGRISNIILVICIFVFCSCNNNNGSSQENKTESPKNTISLLNGMTVSGFGLNDTLNNIKGRIIFPRNIHKSDTNLDLTRINKYWETDLKDFASSVKQVRKADCNDTNLYFLKIKTVNKKQDVISAVFEKKSYLCGEKDTVNDLIIHNYSLKDDKEITFRDMFLINGDNISSFNKMFSSSFGLQDLSSVNFYFEKDIVWLVLKTTDGNKVFGQKYKKVKEFLINDKKR